MKKSVLLPFMMVALLTIGTVATSYGQAKPGMPPASGATQDTVSQPSGPSEEFSGPMRHGHSLEAMMKKLGITDEQKKQIRGLYVAFRDRTRKTRMELMSLKDEKKTMLLSGKIDQQKLVADRRSSRKASQRPVARKAKTAKGSSGTAYSRANRAHS